MILLATLCSQLVFTTSFRVLFFYIQDTFLGRLKIVPLRYQKQRFFSGPKRGVW